MCKSNLCRMKKALQVVAMVGVGILLLAIGVWTRSHHQAIRFASLGDPIPNGEYRSWVFVDDDFRSNDHRKRVIFKWSGSNSLDYLLGHDARWECREQQNDALCEQPSVLPLCTLTELEAARKSWREAEDRYRTDTAKAKDVFDQAAINPFDEKYQGNDLNNCWAPHDWRTKNK